MISEIYLNKKTTGSNTLNMAGGRLGMVRMYMMSKETEQVEKFSTWPGNGPEEEEWQAWKKE